MGTAIPRPAAPARRAFNISVALRRAAEAIAGKPAAAMFALAERGYSSLFEQLIACLISIRTLDEVSLPASLRLLQVARTPRQVARLSAEEIDRLIQPSTFHEAKAPQIHEISVRVMTDFGGRLPADVDVLRSFRGVGPKCAHLALGVALGEPYISVDVHVHRVTNRWGYVRTATPEQTLAALEQKLPRHHWIEINRVLVPFGKHVCTGSRPRCSTCPLLTMCPQVGVTNPR